MILNGSSGTKYISTPESTHNLQPHTPEVQEILGQMPVWTIRLGLAIIGAIIISIITVSLLVRYPVSISSRLTITALTPQLGEVYGQMVMPAAHAGKVRIGQKVNIRFDNFPVARYGIIRGKVTGVSLLAKNHNYVISIQLTEISNSSNHKKIHFTKTMQGNAEIIISGPRIIERIKPVKALADKLSLKI